MNPKSTDNFTEPFTALYKGAIVFPSTTDATYFKSPHNTLPKKKTTGKFLLAIVFWVIMQNFITSPNAFHRKKVSKHEIRHIPI